MERLNRITVETSATSSDLCQMGARLGTDKSPYSLGHHRHPYTAVYDLLFSAIRHQEIAFVEIGVLDNASMKMWHEYFSNAKLFGFDFDEQRLASARKDGLERATYGHMDVSNPDSIRRALETVTQPCDVIIDDSTHLFDHQIAILPWALRCLTPGGIMIIEDVFRGWDETRYSNAIKTLFPYLTAGYFLETEHQLKKSDGNVEPYFNNDKLLVLYRNNVEIGSASDAA